MNKKIEKIKDLRLFLLSRISMLTTEQLNWVPAGYNNNIIWNIAHLICAQQNLCYVRAGLPISVDDKYFSPYLPGKKPEKMIDTLEIGIIKEIFITSVDKLQTDIKKNIFTNYTPSAMILKFYGTEVNNINDAINFLLFHEGFHDGCIISLNRLVQNE